jgi:hypothetical protein
MFNNKRNITLILTKHKVERNVLWSLSFIHRQFNFGLKVFKSSLIPQELQVTLIKTILFNCLFEETLHGWSSLLISLAGISHYCNFRDLFRLLLSWT